MAGSPRAPTSPAHIREDRDRIAAELTDHPRKRPKYLTSRDEDWRRGRALMVKLIESVIAGVPNALTELITLGRTLKKRAADELAYFGRPGRPTAHRGIN